MAKSINNVILLGNLGQDPELSYTQSGNAKVKFSMCTNKPVKNQDGTWGERAQWHNIVAWGKLAEVTAKFLAKGRQTLVRGEVETRSYDDHDGNRRYITEITAGDIVFLSDGGGQGGGGQGGGQGGGHRAPGGAPRGGVPSSKPGGFQPPPQDGPPAFGDEDDIPF